MRKHQLFDRSCNPLSFGSLLSQNLQLVLAVTGGPSTCKSPYLNVNQNQNTSDWKCLQFSQTLSYCGKVENILFNSVSSETVISGNMGGKLTF